MSAPLEGIKVVELASFVAVPAAGTLLADLGADVVKVEVPWGEVYRHATPRRNGYDSQFPLGAAYEMDNRGKRSLALDLALRQAREALARVIAGADILLTNVLPARLDRYGLNPQRLLEERPELIIARLSGFSAQGEQANEPGFDHSAFWALSGLMDVLRSPNSEPAFLRAGLGDHSAGLSLVSGILAALRVRDRTGRGQLVDVNLQHVGFYINGSDTAQSLVTDQAPPVHDRAAPRNPLWNHYRTSDDRWLLLVMIDSASYWPAFVEAVGRPELLEDARFEDPVARYRNTEALVEILDQIFVMRTLAEWKQHFVDKRLIWAPARTVLEAVADPQSEQNGCFSTVNHPEHGKFKTVAPPLRLSDFEMPANLPAPQLSAHTEEVLREAGLDDETIALLVAAAD